MSDEELRQIGGSINFKKIGKILLILIVIAGGAWWAFS
jgi:hypothetical protein